MTVPVFYCRYVIDKDVPESFYKQSLLLVEYSLSIYIDIYIYMYIYIYSSIKNAINANCLNAGSDPY